MRLALVEDNSEECAALAALIKTELAQAGQRSPEITVFPGGEAFLAAWHAGAFDVVLLDIFMDGMDGVEVARRIRQTDADVLLVFCTSSNDFAAESYELDARYYLHKPVTAESVTAMLRRLRLEELERRRAVTLPGGQQVPVRSIQYTEYYNHVVTVHLFPDGSTLRIRTSQAEMEALLLRYEGFLSPCRGVIVNLFMVQHMSGEDLLLRDGHVIRIARRKYKEVRGAYNRFRLWLLRREAST